MSGVNQIKKGDSRERWDDRRSFMEKVSGHKEGTMDKSNPPRGNRRVGGSQKDVWIEKERVY